MTTSKQNARYDSKTIQNELIEYCGAEVLNDLSDEIKDSRFFSIIADEAVDCSNLEQMPIILRFIDNSLNICEEFVQFVECDSGTSGEEIAKKLISTINKIGLDITNARGQGYDGAGNMSGKVKGASSRIKELNQKCIYTLQKLIY